MTNLNEKQFKIIVLGIVIVELITLSLLGFKDYKNISQITEQIKKNEAIIIEIKTQNDENAKTLDKIDKDNEYIIDELAKEIDKSVKIYDNIIALKDEKINKHEQLITTLKTDLNELKQNQKVDDKKDENQQK